MKREKLKQCSIEYLAILFVIWQLVDYYSKLFSIDAGDNPAKIITELMERKGMSYIRLTFPKIERVQYGRSVFKMKRIFNEYLRFVLLPQQNILKPYHADSNDIYSVIEALYVYMVFENDSSVYIDVIYIDNPKAYKYVCEDEKKPYKEDCSYEF